ncbi:MAG: hypothetical protein M0Z82_14885 [Actinomycetota bacterium]|nr:hypothetical protein [Actinomycetota bacterium]
MPALRELRRAGAHVIAVAGIPYGYTLTIWGAGALCTGRFGLPTPSEGFEFVGGASVAYFGLAAVFRRTTEGDWRGERLPVLWENGAALPALAATYGLAQVMPGAGPSFFLVPLVATVFYLVGVSLLVSRFHLDHGPAVEHPHSEPLSLAPGDGGGATEPGFLPPGCEASLPAPGRPSSQHRDAVG